MTAIIGVDCATKPQKTGVALCRLDGERVAVDEVFVGRASQSVAPAIANWLKSNTPALLALDAPLGWPARLGQVLASHSAGSAVDEHPDRMWGCPIRC